MKAILWFLCTTFVSALNITADQQSENQTQSSANRWPDLPYKVPVDHAPGVDFGDITVTKVGAVGQQQQAAAFDAFAGKLARQLATYDERFTAISMATTDRPVASFILKQIPEDLERVPNRYFSSLVRTIAGVMRRYGFRALATDNKAPFSESCLYLELTPSEFYEWTAPVIVDVPSSDFVVQIKIFEQNLDEVPGLSDWLFRSVNGLLSRRPGAAFVSMQFSFEKDGHRFHFLVDPSRDQPRSRPFTNRDAHAALSNWCQWFEYAAEVSYQHDLHSFEIVTASATAPPTIVANGRVWQEDAGSSTFRGKGIAAAAALKSHGPINNTVQEAS